MNIFKNIIRAILPPFFFKMFMFLKNKKNEINLQTDKKIENGDRFYKIEDCTVILPNEHFLDIYQNQFVTYDKFISILSGFIDKSSTVIDIGANVGDSAIPFLKKGIKTVCVEPSSFYLDYLRKNIEINGFEQDAFIVQKVISNTFFSGKLVHEKGTAVLDQYSGDSQDYDSILFFFFVVGLKNISFVKIDTDGFDYDVIISGIEFFKENSPLLYFENFINNNLEGYLKAYDLLKMVGYNKLAIFDNKGVLIIKDGNWDNLKDINTYLTFNDHIDYLDVFCWKNNDDNLSSKIINKYCDKYIKR